MIRFCKNNSKWLSLQHKLFVWNAKENNWMNIVDLPERGMSFDLLCRYADMYCYFMWSIKRMKIVFKSQWVLYEKKILLLSK